MIRHVILDTGPLVAALDASEAHHRWATEQFKTIRLPLITCEAVVTEACHLLRRSERAVAQVGDYLSRGVIECRCALSNDDGRVFDLMRKYRGVPMSLADACLVYLVEITDDSSVFTLDAHFNVYRQLNRRVIPTIAT